MSACYMHVGLQRKAGKKERKEVVVWAGAPSERERLLWIVWWRRLFLFLLVRLFTR